MMDRYVKLVDDLKREAGRGALKIVSVSFFVDETGEIIGRSEFSSKKLFPRSMRKTLVDSADIVADIVGSA